MTQRISEAAREINDVQPARQLDRVATYWKPLEGHRVHILGLGFRPGVKVDTFSPAYPLRDRLIEVGAQPTIEDPYYSAAEIRAAGFEPGAVHDASVVVLNTAHRSSWIRTLPTGVPSAWRPCWMGAMHGIRLRLKAPGCFISALGAHRHPNGTLMTRAKVILVDYSPDSAR